MKRNIKRTYQTPRIRVILFDYSPVCEGKTLDYGGDDPPRNDDEDDLFAPRKAFDFEWE